MARSEKIKVVIPDVGEPSEASAQPDASPENADKPVPVGTPGRVVAAQSLYALMRHQADSRTQ